jgi:hypothetical protein
LAAFLVRLAGGKASEGEAGGRIFGQRGWWGWLLRLRSVLLRWEHCCFAAGGGRNFASMPASATAGYSSS